MRERQYAVVIGKDTILEDGSRVWAQVILPKWENFIPNKLELHETIHTVVSEKLAPGSVEEVSIKPTPGARGHMRPNRFVLAAVVGPDGEDLDGTSMDMLIAEDIAAHGGGDIGAAKSVSKSIVRNNPDEIKAVGFELHNQLTLSGFEVRETIQSVYTGQQAEVIFESADGSQQTFIKDVTENTVFLAKDELPLAA